MSHGKPKGALKVRRTDGKGVVKRAKLMHQGQQQHPQELANPQPDGPTFGAQVSVTDAAVIAAENGGKSEIAARDVEVGTMHTMMVTRLAYLQTVSSPLSAAQARQTLIDGGVEVVGHTPHDKPILAADNGVVPSSVELEANARALLGDNVGRKHAFCWGYTTDGGKTFVNLQPTPRARTTVTGLPAMTTVGFRVAVITWDGVQQPWSSIVELLIR